MAAELQALKALHKKRAAEAAAMEATHRPRPREAMMEHYHYACEAAKVGQGSIGRKSSQEQAPLKLLVFVDLGDDDNSHS
jgi:hypothetical protein